MSQPPRRPIDPRALISQLAAQEAEIRRRTLLAPALPGGRVRVRLAGLVYEFRLVDGFVGWGLFQPIDERLARLVESALPWQRAAYLELFPALRLTLLWPDRSASRQGRWWAVPYNASDAQQRFSLTGTDPVPVELVDPTDGAAAFEQVIARVDGHTLWFDGPDLRADPTQAAWLREMVTRVDAPTRWLPGLAASARLGLVYARLNETERRHLTQRQPAGQSAPPRHPPPPASLEARLRHALALADAELHAWHEVMDSDGQPSAVVIEWSLQGQHYRYRSAIDQSLTVVSSGICLSDRDRDFDLTSLVSVMTDAF